MTQQDGDDGPTHDPDRLNSLNLVGTVSYLLHLIVAVACVIPGTQLGVFFLVVALILDWTNRSGAQGTWQASHFDWRIRSVFIAGGLYVLTAPLWVLMVLPGMVAWWLISVWFLFRIIKGMARLNAGKTVE